MTTFGLPPEMFWVFVATIVAGSLGAIHYVVAHIILGRPFAEIPPPVVREGGLPEPGVPPEPGSGTGSGGSGGEGSGGPTGAGSEGSAAGGRPDGERTDG